MENNNVNTTLIIIYSIITFAIGALLGIYCSIDTSEKPHNSSCYLNEIDRIEQQIIEIEGEHFGLQSKLYRMDTCHIGGVKIYTDAIPRQIEKIIQEKESLLYNQLAKAQINYEKAKEEE